MNRPLSTSARRVQEAIEKRGFDFIVLELSESTRTAQDAAAAIGCDVGQIVKSLIFREEDSDEPILALVSGNNRVDPEKLSAVGAGQLAKADAGFARRHSGFAIGGIPPCGHETPIRTFIDEDLLRFDTVWAAAGTPNAVFELDPAALPPLTSGVICDMKTD
ncbi:MAG: YbaK/EbsC family protein [Proteobacteria bacterium]|nr:MAG: YbaK/EbsC family protein [Pseudomonadota bacterium]